MRIARFWAKESTTTTTKDNGDFYLSVWEWSESSISEAREKARASLQRLVQKSQTSGFLDHLHSRTYGYGDKPPREEIVEEIHDAAGNTIATISCNIYGALVLNTAQLMFIDVDIPPEPLFAGFRKFFARLMGKKIETQAEQVENKIHALTTKHTDLKLRVYRTAAGFRCVVMGRVIEPASEEAQRLFKEFESDPLYVRLSKNQECYRARLTPKHWRIQCPPPPNRFPWDTPQEEQKFREWQQEYSRLSENSAVCKRVTTDASSFAADADMQNLLRLHDRYTKAESALPLA